jgi:hypothetical protein
MKTLKQLCTPRQSVFDRSRRDVVLDLTDLIDREGHIDPHEFFEENYFTDGMKRLLREAFRRFERQSAQGVFVLSQAMGGWEDAQYDCSRIARKVSGAALFCDG